MASTRSRKTRSRSGTRSSSAASGRRSPKPRAAGGSSGGGRGDGPLDDIELLNVHRYPESMPASIVAQVRNNRIYQKRLEDLLKGLPGKRSSERSSGWNQLMQQKLEETSSRDVDSDEPDAIETVEGDSDSGTRVYRAAEEVPAESPVRRFLRKLWW